MPMLCRLIVCAMAVAAAVQSAALRAQSSNQLTARRVVTNDAAESAAAAAAAAALSSELIPPHVLSSHRNLMNVLQSSNFIGDQPQLRFLDEFPYWADLQQQQQQQQEQQQSLPSADYVPFYYDATRVMSQMDDRLHVNDPPAKMNDISPTSDLHMGNYAPGDHSPQLHYAASESLFDVGQLQHVDMQMGNYAPNPPPTPYVASESFDVGQWQDAYLQTATNYVPQQLAADPAPDPPPPPPPYIVNESFDVGQLQSASAFISFNDQHPEAVPATTASPAVSVDELSIYYHAHQHAYQHPAALSPITSPVIFEEYQPSNQMYHAGPLPPSEQPTTFKPAAASPHHHHHHHHHVPSLIDPQNAKPSASTSYNNLAIGSTPFLADRLPPVSFVTTTADAPSQPIHAMAMSPSAEPVKTNQIKLQQQRPPVAAAMNMGTNSPSAADSVTVDSAATAAVAVAATTVQKVSASPIATGLATVISNLATALSAFINSLANSATFSTAVNAILDSIVTNFLTPLCKASLATQRAVVLLTILAGLLIALKLKKCKNGAQCGSYYKRSLSSAVPFIRSLGADDEQMSRIVQLISAYRHQFDRLPAERLAAKAD